MNDYYCPDCVPGSTPHKVSPSCVAALLASNRLLIEKIASLGNEYAIVCRFKEDNFKLREALLMVLGSTLMEADGHDWSTCEQPSCMFARATLSHNESPLTNENSEKK